MGVLRPPSAQLQRHFLPWDRPLLPQAVDLLCAGWEGRGPIDLSEVLVVVPTQQAGRRLREALAVRAAAQRQAVFAPRVEAVDRLVEPDPADAVATPVESLLAWVATLQEIDLAACRGVVPVDPPRRDLAWALGLAGNLVRLQREMAKGGLRLADVTARFDDVPERMRWLQLGALEQLQGARLARQGLVDSPSARLAAARRATSPAGATRVIVMATPDLSSLAVELLAGWSRTVPVEIAIHAPADEAPGFDDWGRPLTPAWTRRVLALPPFPTHVHVCADVAAEAERIAGLAAEYAEAPATLAVGIADPTALAAVETALRHARIPVFNPEGRPRRSDGFFHLLSALADFARAPEFAHVAALARCPDVLQWMRARAGAEFSTARWLDGLDRLHARHLPADLPAAIACAGGLRDFPHLRAELELMQELRDRLGRGVFAESVSAVLAELFAPAVAAVAADWEETASAWMEILRSCSGAVAWVPGLSRADWWQVALRVLGESRSVPEKPPGARELLGWLELPWEEAPHLVIAGVNEGSVPEAVPADAFLPESLRLRLGLDTSETRRARDAYLLQTLAAVRATTGRLDLLLAKFSGTGEPLRPSRLLFNCTDDELPERVRYLFRTPPPAGRTIAWRRAWVLELPSRPPPTRVAVTSLKAWLRCPLRYYLRHVLGMEPVDSAKAELDAFDFGTLCHSALEAFARDAGVKDSQDAAVVRTFLLAELDRRMHARYGRELSLPLLVQLESARQRLGRAAEIQVAERAAGWSIVEAERKFELNVDGLVIAGKIDRIERNEITGAWRVLDYKTSDTAVNPEDAHLRSVRRDEEMAPWRQWTAGKRPRTWVDLQLPLYREVLRAEVRDAPIDCAYFNLPKSTADTAVEPWVDYTPELQMAAWGCVRGVVEAIRGGKFWPPAELRGRDAELDDMAALFHGTAAESVRWREETR